MKNHIIFKFIAIVLCAASLMGAVGSGVGMFVMAEAELYDRTVEEAYEETLRSFTQGVADHFAQQYATVQLGNAEEGLVDSYYGSRWYYDIFDFSRLGYVIRDAEGNAVSDQSLNGSQKAVHIFEFPASGSYLNVLSVTPREEYEQAHSPVLVEGVTTRNGEDYVYNAIPETGAEVYFVDILYDDGSTESIGAPVDPLGSLFNHDGTVIFSSENDNMFPDLESGLIAVSITFQTLDNQCIYEAISPAGVLGSYSWAEGSGTTMTLRDLEEQVMTYDAIPDTGCYVSRVSVSFADDFSESAGGAPDIGYLDYDENGNVRFVASHSSILTYSELPVTHITFHYENEELVYEARDPNGVGYFYLENDQLIFRTGAFMAKEAEADVTEPVENTDRYVSDKVHEPPTDGVDVYRMEYWNEVNECVMGVESTQSPLGNVFRNADGNIVFRCDGLFGTSFETVYISLFAADGELLYQAYSPDAEIGEGDAIGQFTYDENGDMIFITDLSYTAPAAEADIAATEVMTESPESSESFLAEAQKDVKIYSVPNEKGSDQGVLKKGSVAEIIRLETSNGIQWGLTDMGWIQMQDMVQVEAPVEETVPETTEVPAETIPTMTFALETIPEETIIEETVPAVTEVPAEPGNFETYSYYDPYREQTMTAEITYETLPEYTVEVQLAENAYRYEHEWMLIRLVYTYQKQLPATLAVCLLVFAIMAVYLCCAAGKKPGTTEIHAAGLNCIPLDLYLAAGIGGVVLLGIAGTEGTEYLLRSDVNTALLYALLCAFAASLLIVGFCFACAAQFKTPGGYWWRNSLCGWCIRLVAVCWKWFKGFCVRFARVGAPIAKDMGSRLWKILVAAFLFGKRFCIAAFEVAKKFLLWLWAQVKKYGSLMGKALARFYDLLPLTWQWLMTGFILVFLLYVALRSYKVGWILMGFGLFFAVILYAASAFGILLENAKRMSKGDLDSKVEDKMLLGGFKDFAVELNGLADVAVVAAQKQLKSERMKTELITNVSHDIKTPLTSIINYVDLLQKPHTDAQQEQYLEVLDRQSQRLKKLIDDLMEMSKASTGNLTVDIGRVDAVEAVNQALGEFADKLDKAQLIAVFRQPEEEVFMMADGRLVWRVMSNLLSNAVKYALPGTRLYVDLQKVDSKVIISMKNISREELNVNADELLERFVRGDVSRNTEGSGLGLNIAQSLMELQKGQLQILVDGDLFKVTLIFPSV